MARKDYSSSIITIFFSVTFSVFPLSLSLFSCSLRCGKLKTKDEKKSSQYSNEILF